MRTAAEPTAAPTPRLSVPGELSERLSYRFYVSQRDLSLLLRETKRILTGTLTRTAAEGRLPREAGGWVSVPSAELCLGPCCSPGPL